MMLCESCKYACAYPLLRGHFDALLLHCIIPLCDFSRADAELWRADPQEFIRRQFDADAELLDPRVAALQLVCDVAGKRDPTPTRTRFHAADGHRAKRWWKGGVRSVPIHTRR